MGSGAVQDIRNVALAGGTGLIGSLVAKSLIESRQFNVTILGRGGRKVPHHAAKLVVVDYTDAAQLTKALEGQDAVVSTLSRDATLLQIPLIDAAVKCGVKRFIPSEFGANLQNSDARALPNYKNKVLVEKHLEEKAKNHDISYTYIYNNMFLDWSIEVGLVLNLRKASIHLYNGGERAVSMIRVSTAAKAVVGVLAHSNETKNRPVYIHEVLMSQRQLLAYAKQVYPDKDWSEEHVDLEGLEAKIKSQPPQGGSSLSTFHVYAVKGAFSEEFGNQYGETDNKMLGIQTLSADDIKLMLTEIMDKSVPCV